MVGLTGVLSQPAQATSGAISPTINFQGRLLNSAGAVVADGNYNMQFNIYKNGPGNVAGDTGGTLLWTEQWLNDSASWSTTGVVVKNGYFSVNLGSYCTFAGSTCQGNTNLGTAFNESVMWLSMTVGGGVGATSATCTPFSACANSELEMLPMKALSSAPFAQTSQSCITCLLQAPTGTQNVIQPTATGVVGLTVNGTSFGGGAATALVVAQTQAAADISVTNTGATSQNLLSVTQSTSAYTGTALLVNVAAGSGSFASGNFLDLQANSVSKFAVGSAGAVTLAGNQTADVTTAAGSTPATLVFQPGNSTTATSTGASFTLQAGNDSGVTSATGGTLNLKGGNPSVGATLINGSVNIDTGTGGTAGNINVGTTNIAHNIHVGDGGTSTVQAITIGSSNAVASTVSLQGGTTPNTAVSIGTSGAGGITIDSGTTGNVNVGNGANAKAVTVGSSNTTSATTIQGGTGAVALLTGANGSGAAGNITLTPGTSSSGNAGVIVKSSTNSTAALQVINSSSHAVLTVDTTANTGQGALVLGASTNNGQLVFDNSTNGNTAAILSGATAANGGSGYTLTLPLSGGAGLQCLQSSVGSTVAATVLQFGSCAGSTPTLQQAYGVSGSPATVTLNNTNNGILFQNPAASGTTGGYTTFIQNLAVGAVDGLDISSAGTGALLKVTDSTTPTDVLTIADGGVTTFKSQTNSATAFQIQSSAGTAILTGDTTNMQVSTDNLNVGQAVNASSSARLFSDGFENGNEDMWSATNTGIFVGGEGGAGTITFPTTTVHSGKYAEELVTAANGAYQQMNFTAQSTLYARTYFYGAALPNPTFLMDLGPNAMGGANHIVLKIGASGDLCYTYNGAADVCSATVPSTSTWHKLEAKYISGSGANGTLQYWLDGVSAATVTTGAWTLSMSYFALGSSSSSTTASGIYFDDVAVDTVPTGDSGSLYTQDSLHVTGSATVGGSLEATSVQGYGIKANSTNNVAVIGSSVNSFGVYGYAQATSSSIAGVWGSSWGSISGLFQSDNNSNVNPTLVSRQSTNVGNTGDLLDLQNYHTNLSDTNVLSVGYTGNTLIQPVVNSTTAFQVQNASGVTLLGVDTATNNTNNMLTNPSIETGGTPPTGWTAKNGSGTSTVSQVASPAYDSGHSMSMVTTGAATNAGVTQSVAGLAANTRYDLAVYVYSQNGFTNAAGSQGQFDMGFGTSGVDTTCLANQAAPAVSWTRLTCSFYTPASLTTPYIYFKQDDATPRTWYVDAAVLETDANATSIWQDGQIALNGTVTTPLVVRPTADNINTLQIQNSNGSSIFSVDTTDTNLVVNPGLEVNTVGWTYSGAQTNAVGVFRDTSQSYLGLASLKFIMSATSTDQARYTFTPSSLITAGSTYTMSFWAKDSAGSYATLTYGRREGGADSSCVTTGAISTTWTRFTCTFTWTTITSPYIYISAGTASKTINIDAVSLEPGSIATPYGSGNIYFNGPVNSPVNFADKTNSPTSFQIQNSSSVSLFTADTANERVIVGPAAGDTVGALLVLGNKTNAGDPAGVAGAMYYNSSSNLFRCFQNGAWSDCVGLDPDSERQTAFYNDEFFQPNAAAGTGPWTCALVGSGGSFPTLTPAIASHPGVDTIVSTAAGGTGYYCSTGITATVANEQILTGGETFELVFEPLTVGTVTFRLGYSDKPNGLGPGNGVYITVSAGTGTATGITRVANVSTTTAAIATLSTSTWYRARVTVSPTGSSQIFTIYNMAGGVVGTQTNTTALPSLSVGSGFMGDDSGSVIENMDNVDYMAEWYTGAPLAR